MKKLYALCYGVILLCIVGTAILLIFTPDTIPVHYNFAGEVDRFGSKYENLIWLMLSNNANSFPNDNPNVDAKSFCVFVALINNQAYGNNV